MQRNSSAEGWAYRLDPYALKLQCAQQLPASCPFVGIAAIERRLDNRHFKLTGVERDLADKSSGRTSAIRLSS